MLITAVQEGTGRRMASGYGVKASLAGKTGTSQNYSDAWFISYNQDLVWNAVNNEYNRLLKRVKK